MRLPTAAAFALLATAAFAPKAHAECGDYLMSSHAAKQKSAPDKPAPPCHGPHCSQAPSIPAMPPAPAPTVAPSHEAALVSRLAVAMDADSSPLLDETTTPPIHHSDPIFHPPRMSR